MKSADNKEYLTKTFTESDNKLGAIFMDMRNTSDFSDKNTMIYGHNMKIGGESMRKNLSIKNIRIAIFIHRMEKQGLIPCFQQLL